jgi:hypothetical protein
MDRSKVVGSSRIDSRVGRGPAVQLPDKKMATITTLIRKLLSRENVFALLLCLILSMLIIVTADAAPQWIYQGF